MEVSKEKLYFPSEFNHFQINTFKITSRNSTPRPETFVPSCKNRDACSETFLCKLLLLQRAESVYCAYH